MNQVRLYDKDDLNTIRISANMPCPRCEGRAEIENPVYHVLIQSGLTLEEFGRSTGINLEAKPRQVIVCPHCEDGIVEIWFYLSDLNRVFKHTANSILGNIEPAFHDALSNLDRAYDNRIEELKDEIADIHTTDTNNLAALRSDLTQALADIYVALTNTIHDLSSTTMELKDRMQAINTSLELRMLNQVELHEELKLDIDALHTDFIALQNRIFDQAVLDKADRAISEQDQVIKKVFSTKENE